MFKHPIFSLFLVISVLITLFSSQTRTFPSSAQAQSEPDEWRELMTLVPNSAATDGSFLNFTNLSAAFEIRPIDPLPDALILDDSDTSDRIVAVMMGQASLPQDLGNFRFVTEMAPTVGFDFLDIHSALYYGLPPSSVTILDGDFDPTTIQQAYETRDYTLDQSDDLSLMCSAEGCAEGAQFNADRIDRSNPFGGQLGREQPILFSSELFISSADYTALENLQATRNGTQSSILDVPEYNAIVSFSETRGQRLQAVIIPPDTFSFTFPLLDDLNPEQVESIMQQLGIDGTPEERNTRLLPDYAQLFMLDTVEGDEQVVHIGVLYINETDAQLAAQRIDERLPDTYSTEYNLPLSNLFEDLDITPTSAEILHDETNDRYITFVSFRAPLPSNEPDPDGRLVSSSRIYTLFYRAILANDLLWLMSPSWFPDN